MAPPPPPAEPFTPPTDSAAPTRPGSLRARVLHRRLRIALSWERATDDRGVLGYRVYRNGRLLKVLATRSWVDRAVRRDRTYRYAVRAYDAAGNVGPARAVAVKTPRS